ncbi:MAG: hypothetical protein GY909_16060 [Oligoflexia bacterium]|nr:hypothetical protein [Oligoflexia bacterium]
MFVKYRIFIRIAMILLLVVAILPMPYVYYMGLRIVLSVYAILELYYKSERKIEFGIMVLIYNPFLPIHATKAIWVLVNVINIIILGLIIKKEGR